nr:transposase family protein [Streptomyces coelicoflavus]
MSHRPPASSSYQVIQAERPKRRPHHDLTPTDQTLNRALSCTRVPVERGAARLKCRRIFRHARCSPNRMTSIARAVLTLERHR